MSSPASTQSFMILRVNRELHLEPLTEQYGSAGPRVPTCHSRQGGRTVSSPLDASRHPSPTLAALVNAITGPRACSQADGPRVLPLRSAGPYSESRLECEFDRTERPSPPHGGPAGALPVFLCHVILPRFSVYENARG